MTRRRTRRLRRLPVAAATLALATTLGVPGGARTARADVLQLLDNTQVAGKILHYYDGAFQVETAGGQKLDIPRDKIKSITFKLPPARAEYASPEKTFRRWHDAVARGDVATVIDCYALMYQGMVHAQLGQAGDDWKKMQKEIEGTRFEVKGAKVTGDTATLKVQKAKGDDVLTAELHLVLENGEWKMTP